MLCWINQFEIAAKWTVEQPLSIDLSTKPYILFSFFSINFHDRSISKNECTDLFSTNFSYQKYNFNFIIRKDGPDLTTSLCLQSPTSPLLSKRTSVSTPQCFIPPARRLGKEPNRVLGVLAQEETCWIFYFTFDCLHVIGVDGYLLCILNLETGFVGWDPEDCQGKILVRILSMQTKNHSTIFTDVRSANLPEMKMQLVPLDSFVYCECALQ